MPVGSTHGAESYYPELVAVTGAEFSKGVNQVSLPPACARLNEEAVAVNTDKAATNRRVLFITVIGILFIYRFNSDGYIGEVKHDITCSCYGGDSWLS